ncbi:MAG: methyltransferase [Tatlockia sp.]|nr:methyltransferase [Tatlockia sp.]
MWISLFLLIFITFILFQKKLRQKIALKRWRLALELDKHAPVFQKLYADIDGFALSRQARKEQDAIEYLYGEIIFEPFIALLSLCNPNSSTVFYDLGSGTGKAVLACAMVFDINKSYGIELFPSLNKTALSQQQRLSKIAGYQSKADSIRFINNDFLKIDLVEASLIFINSTAFFGESWDAVSRHLEQIKSGALVISTSKSLHSRCFITVRKTEVAMSWGYVTAIIQRRID